MNINLTDYAPGKMYRTNELSFVIQMNIKQIHYYINYNVIHCIEIVNYMLR